MADRTCSVAGCDGLHLARGWCKTHYRRWQRTGDIELEPVSDQDRFWSKVDRSAGPDGCWPWTAGINTYGYGKFWLDGHDVGAHRIAWELEHGDPPPPGVEIDHACHNGTGCELGCECPHRRCCNPRHMVVTDQRTNTLRGSGISAKNAAKTHCEHGHPLSGANLYIHKTSGGRCCRTCSRAAQRRYKKRLAFR